MMAIAQMVSVLGIWRLSFLQIVIVLSCQGVPNCRCCGLSWQAVVFPGREAEREGRGIDAIASQLGPSSCR